MLTQYFHEVGVHVETNRESECVKKPHVRL